MGINIPSNGTFSVLKGKLKTIKHFLHTSFPFWQIHAKRFKATSSPSSCGPSSVQIIMNRTCYIWSLYGWQWFGATEHVVGLFCSPILTICYRFTGSTCSLLLREDCYSFVTHFLSPLRLGHYRSGPDHGPMRARSLAVHFSHYFRISFTKGPKESAHTGCSEGPFVPLSLAKTL